jgi:hypothetical protein
MQHETIDVVGAQMLQRTGQRLGDLHRETGLGIVGQAMVLSALVGEFGLQEEIFAGHDSGAIGCGQSLTDSGFEIVAALVGGVDGAETGADREFGESCGAVFFPGCTVEKIREGHRGYCPMKTLNHRELREFLRSSPL